METTFENEHKNKLDYVEFIQKELLESVDVVVETNQRALVKKIELAYRRNVTLKQRLLAAHRIAVAGGDGDVEKEITSVGRNPKKHVDYHTFLDKARACSVELDGCAEIEVGTTVRSYVCPLTQALLVEPVTSRKCGHSFSKRALKDYLRGRPKVCPVTGCNVVIDTKGYYEDERLNEEISKHVQDR